VCLFLTVTYIFIYIYAYLNDHLHSFVSLSAKHMSTSERSLLWSQPQYMRKLLSIVKSKVQTSCVDGTMEYTLGFFWRLTGEILYP
jgi:Zyg-11 family protein